MRLPLVTLVALALATPAAAQMAYRYVFPDGRVVYSDQPVPGAQLQSAIAPPPPSADPAPSPPAAAPAADPAPASAAAPAAVPGARWPPPPDATQPAPASAPAPAPALERVTPPAAQPAPDRIAMFAAADDEVRAAERNLAAAKARLDAGREPLPGERMGLAGGGSRLNQSYWNRQRQLETVVSDAQAQLDRAVAGRNAAR